MSKKQADNIVVIEGLNKWFDKLQVLVDVDFKLKKGEKAVICGPSGSGKSTFIRCINGLETFGTGTLTVNGIQMSADPSVVRQVQVQTGMLFQSFNLFPHLTILENCTLAPILVKKIAKEAAIETAVTHLKRVKIDDQADKYPIQLSGGQQQRAAIARALCMDPALMLFDEPTSALDPEMIAEVLDEILELSETGMSMICVTHEMSFAKKAADTIYFMADGRIIESAAADKFFVEAKSKRLKKFLEQISYNERA